MKKRILYILTLILLLFSLNIIMPVKADSGWDSSYDSGSSSSSSSSSSSHSGSSSSNDSYMDEIIFWIIIAVVFIACLRSKSFQDKINLEPFTNEDKERLLKEADNIINADELKEQVFNIYKDIQTAWMNFDTNKIRELTTDEIYNMYSSQLETLKLKNQRNMMTDIEKKDAKIIEEKTENGITTIKAYLKVNTYDYVINDDTKEVVRGTDKNKLEIEYLITLIKQEGDIKEIEKCPNCGAPVKMNASAKCPYCDSTLVKTSSKYVMSKKECIGQRKL